MEEAKKKREEEYKEGIAAKLKLLTKKENSFKVSSSNSWMLI